MKPLLVAVIEDQQSISLSPLTRLRKTKNSTQDYLYLVSLSFRTRTRTYSPNTEPSKPKILLGVISSCCFCKPTKSIQSSNNLSQKSRDANSVTLYLCIAASGYLYLYLYLRVSHLLGQALTKRPDDLLLCVCVCLLNCKHFKVAFK